MREDMRNDLVIDTFKMACFQRSPDKRAGLIVHSDRGSHYASCEFSQELKECSITQSMSRKANCLDNACAESLFGSFKVERLHDQRSKRFAKPRMKWSHGCSGITGSACTQPWAI